MKAFITSIFLTLSLNYGYSCSCFYISDYFCPSINWVAPYIEQYPIHIVRGKVQSINGYLMDIAVSESLFGSIDEPNITVIGQDGLNCNQYLDVFEADQEVILALNNGFETENFNLSGCGRFYLHIENEMVVGLIDSLSESTPYEDFRGQVQQCLQVTDVEDTPNDPEGVKIFPNPCTDQVTVNLPNAINGVFHISIINANGQLVNQLENTTTAANLDLSAYPSGLYFIKVVQGDRSYVEKLIKT